jgi:hypothetical protein
MPPYQVSGNGVADTADGTYILPDPTGWRQAEHQAWLAPGFGAQPAAAVAPATLRPTVAQLQAALITANVLTPAQISAQMASAQPEQAAP